MPRPETGAVADPREQQARQGDREALASLLGEQADRLHRWIDQRLNSRVRGRVAASDIVQDVYLAADHRLSHFGRLTDMPFAVWVRLLAEQRLVEVHRRYLATLGRDAERELPLDAGSGSDGLAARLPGPRSSPSRSAIRHESRALVRQALDELAPSDREVLILRHDRALSNDTVAALLGLTRSAATKRYLRALARLRTILARTPGLLDEAEGAAQP